MPENHPKSRRVLVVEDEYLISIMIEQMLVELGYEVTLISKMDDAVIAAKSSAIDLAILDLHLRLAPSTPIAQALKERGIPFVLSTGSDRRSVPDWFLGAPTLSKPFTEQELARTLATLSSAPQQAEKGG